MSDYDSSAPPLARTSVDPHTDLISFLSAAQKCGVELLTTTWQPGLESLGEGGTAEVSQSMVNRGLGFAYKRSSHEDWDRLPRSFKHMISEMVALESARVKLHPNIVDMEGVCWEVRSEVAVPVLVFPRAELGDLRAFMQTQLGMSLDFDARLELCVGIAKGVAVLHDSGIVHGDIKPQNILIHQDNTGALVAKVSDLGYAGLGPNSELIRLPRSRPWVDPEWHEREFTIETAQKMDLYSFGMVCLWVLFRDQLLDHLRNCSSQKADLPEAMTFFTSNDAPQSALEHFQQTGELPSIVETIVKTSPLLKDDQRTDIVSFFHKLICNDRATRESDWKKLLRLLSRQGEDSSHSPGQALDLETNRPLHADFRIALCNYRLCSSDYRVRSTIFDSLKARTNVQSKTYCQTCSKSAHFQLAVCYTLGFGVAKDDKMSQVQLELGSRHQDDLEMELVILKQRQLDSTHSKSNFRALFDQGYISGENLPSRYREQGELTRAVQVYRREIADMQSVLGEAHGVVLLLKSALVSILREAGQLEESETLGIQVVETFQTVFGNEHPDTIVSMENLAQTWTQQRLWTRGCEIEEHIVTLRASEQGPNHASTLTASANLATTYRVLGRLQEAEQIELRVVREFTSAFGENHPQTLEAMDRQALTLLAQEQFQQSLTIREKVLERKCRILGSNHVSTLLAKGNLAKTYRALCRWTEAISTYIEVMESLRGVLGISHEQSLTCAEQLAETYVKAGEFDNAIRQQQRLVADRIEIHSESDPRALRSMAALAEMYADQGRLDEADGVISAVLLRRQAAITSKHPDALTALSNAASVRIAQGRNDEAEALLTEVLAVEKQISTTLSSDTITSINNLATVLLHQGRLEEARDLFLEVVTNFTAIIGPEHQNTLQSSGNLARTLYRMGHSEEAKKILLNVRSVRVRKFGKDDLDSICFADDLSLIYRNEGSWTEAEQLADEIVQSSTRLLGPEHPDTLKRKRQLAGIYKQLERWKDAEELYDDVFIAGKSAGAVANTETLAAGTQLFNIFKRQEKWSRAEVLLREMVELAEEEFGHDSFITLLCMAQLATCLAAQENLDEALRTHPKVVRGLENIGGDPASATILDVLSNLASKYADLGLWEESERLYASVIQAATVSLGSEHQTTSVSRQNLEMVRKERAASTRSSGNAISGK